MATVTLSQSDLLDMRSMISTPKLPDRETKRLELKTKCAERVKTWSNTLQAHRRNKETERIANEAEQEGLRQKLDLEEEAISDKLRNDINERAEQQRLERSEKLKNLRVQQHFSDAIHFREKQIEIRKEKIEAEKKVEQLHHVAMINSIERSIKKDADEVNLRLVRINMIQEDVANQIKDLNERKAQEAIVLKREADLLISSNVRAFQQEKDTEAKKRYIGKQNLDYMMKMNDQLIDIRGRIAEKDLEEKDKLEALRNDEDIRKEARKVIERNRNESLQRARQGLIDRAVQALGDVKTDEDVVLQRQVEDIEQKKQEVADAKKRKQDTMWQSIVQSRDHQIELHKQAKATDKLLDRKIAKQWNDMAVELTAKDNKLAKKKKDRLLEISHAQEVQAVFDRSKRIEEDLARRGRSVMGQESEAQRRDWIEKEERLFLAEAKVQIELAESEGRNAYPLKNAVFYKPVEILAYNCK